MKRKRKPAPMRYYYSDAKGLQWFFTIDLDAITRAKTATGIDLAAATIVDFGRLVEACGTGGHQRMVDLIGAAQMSTTPQVFTVDVPTLRRGILALARALDAKFNRDIYSAVVKAMPSAFRPDPITSDATKV